MAVFAARAFAQVVVETYVNREFGINFDVPAGWRLDTEPPVGLLTLRDTLGLLEINVAARVLPKKKDVREFADKVEKEYSFPGVGVSVTDIVKNPQTPEREREVLKTFLYDDTKETDEARKKYEAEKQKRRDAGLAAADDAIPDDPEFLAKITTRLYSDANAPRAFLVYYVIGGGVGYVISLAANRGDFFVALPLAQDVIAALKPDRLSGGRYALPDAKAVAAARMGIIMGKVLRNGEPVSGVNVNLYASAADRAKGVPTCTVRSDHYGEYNFVNLTPGKYFLLEAEGISDTGQRVRSVQPITDVDVGGGRVTFVNIEVTPR